MKLDDDSEFERLTQRFARQARDFDDLQNEIAGREVGRIERFLPETAQSGGGSGKSKHERAEALTRLQLLLIENPAYAALYAETAGVLTDAQSRLEQALERVQLEIDRASLTFEEMRGGAAQLPDGTRVYRDKNGVVRSEDGARVDDDLAASIVWKGDEPSFEDIQANVARGERLKALEVDIHAGQAEIGDMQTLMDDEDDPPTTDDLDEFKDRAAEIASGIEERLEKEAGRSAPTVAETAVENTTEILVPKL